MTSPDRFDQSINRLARNMTITQAALSMKPAAALFALNVDALLSAVVEVKEALEEVPSDRVITASSRVIGPYTADLLAEAITSGQVTPDTVPDSWKE